VNLKWWQWTMLAFSIAGAVAAFLAQQIQWARMMAGTGLW